MTYAKNNFRMWLYILSYLFYVIESSLRICLNFIYFLSIIVLFTISMMKTIEKIKVGESG